MPPPSAEGADQRILKLEPVAKAKCPCLEDRVPDRVGQLATMVSSERIIPTKPLAHRTIVMTSPLHAQHLHYILVSLVVFWSGGHLCIWRPFDLAYELPRGAEGALHTAVQH